MYPIFVAFCDLADSSWRQEAAYDTSLLWFQGQLRWLTCSVTMPKCYASTGGSSREPLEQFKLFHHVIHKRCVIYFFKKGAILHFLQ